jgi:hypothetical protein
VRKAHFVEQWNQNVLVPAGDKDFHAGTLQRLDGMMEDQGIGRVHQIEKNLHLSLVPVRRLLTARA